MDSLLHSREFTIEELMMLENRWRQKFSAPTGGLCITVSLFLPVCRYLSYLLYVFFFPFFCSVERDFAELRPASFFCIFDLDESTIIVHFNSNDRR